MAEGKSENLEKILAKGEQLAEAREKERARYTLLRYIEYPSTDTDIYVNFNDEEYKALYLSDAKHDGHDVDISNKAFYAGYRRLSIAILKSEKLAETETEAHQLYQAIKSGLKTTATERMRITDIMGRNLLELFDPKNYVVGLETMERLAKKYHIESFEKDMHQVKKLTLLRLKIGCKEAMPVGKWLEERGY